MVEFTTPLGTRDLIQQECIDKRSLEQHFRNIFTHWGYEEVMTPMLEYYQTFSIANMKEKEIYKILDASNRIVTLRGDMTIPISRVVATKFKDCTLPMRFQYCANVFKVKERLSGNQNESTDCGVELYGVDDVIGDLEILACALDALSVLEGYQYTLEIGNRNFFYKACEVLSLDKATVEKLADYIDRKSLKELQDYVDALAISDQHKHFFKQLPWLCGDLSIMNEAREIAFDPSLNDILDELQQLCDKLKELGYEKYISIDLSKLPRMEYYTGLIFDAYVEGIGDSILSGGRYDQLTQRFGKSISAVGFAIRLDALAGLVHHENTQKCVTLYYPKHLQIEALTQAQSLRETAIVKLQVDETSTQIQTKEEA